MLEIIVISVSLPILLCMAFLMGKENGYNSGYSAGFKVGSYRAIYEMLNRERASDFITQEQYDSVCKELEILYGVRNDG